MVRVFALACFSILCLTRTFDRLFFNHQTGIASYTTNMPCVFNSSTYVLRCDFCCYMCGTQNHTHAMDHGYRAFCELSFFVLMVVIVSIQIIYAKHVTPIFCHNYLTSTFLLTLRKRNREEIPQVLFNKHVGCICMEIQTS